MRVWGEALRQYTCCTEHYTPGKQQKIRPVSKLGLFLRATLWVFFVGHLRVRDFGFFFVGHPVEILKAHEGQSEYVTIR